MDFDFSNILSGLAGATGGSAVAAVFFKAWLQEMENLRKEVKSLREEKIVVLEKRLDKVEQFNDECPGAELKANLANILGWTKRNDGKLDLISSNVNQLVARSEGDRVWISNLDKSHQDHVRDHSIHQVHNRG